MGIFNNKQHDDTNDTNTIHPDASAAGASPSIFGSDDNTDQQLVAAEPSSSTDTPRSDLSQVDAVVDVSSVYESTDTELASSEVVSSAEPVVSLPGSVPSTAPDLPVADIVDSASVLDTATESRVGERPEIIQDTTIDASYDYASKPYSSAPGVPDLPQASGDVSEESSLDSFATGAPTAVVPVITEDTAVESVESTDSGFVSSDYSNSNSSIVGHGSASADTDEITSIKDQALQQLSPLVSLLEQTPEEKFHTTMMLLQSTEDRSLIKEAYAAAQNISDERVKAQALLDIVNEINYLTQHTQ